MTDVVAAVIRRGNKFLLCRRPTHKRHGGLFEFAGGKLHVEEDLPAAVTRELDEELGVKVRRVGDELIAVSDGGSEFVIRFVEVEIDGEPVPHEHDELRWVTLDELRELPVAPSDAVFADFLIRKSQPSERSSQS